MITPQVKDRNPPEENLGSFYMGRMRQPAAPPRRLMPRGVLTGFMLFSFAAILWYAYPQGQEKYSDIDIPVIAASKEPYKFKPDNPGGMEVQHQDSTIFDPLEKDAARHVEKLRPKPEEPLDKAEVLKSTAPIDRTPHSLDLKTVSHGTEKIISGADEKPFGEQKPAPAKPEAKSTEPVAKAAEKDKPAAVKSPQPARAPAPAEKTAASPVAKTVPASKAPPGTKPAAGAGAYIQLGAYRDTAGAKAEWARMQKKYPETLGKLKMRTEKVDLGAKGVLTRLQAGQVSPERAKSVCEILKAGGQGCIVIH